MATHPIPPGESILARVHEINTMGLFQFNNDSGWANRHAAAWANPRKPAPTSITNPSPEGALHQMIRGLAAYCDWHARQFESPVGEDGVIGDSGVLPIIQGLRTLLNGELGRFDGDTLDTTLCTIARMAGFEESEL